jgi:MFS family permease
MKHGVLLTVLCLLMGWYGFSRFELEDDPVRSLGTAASFKTRVFKTYHNNSFFQNRLFIDVTDASDADVTAIGSLAEKASYKPFDAPKPDAETLWSLVPQLPPEVVERALSSDTLVQRAQKIVGFALLPGGETLLAQAESDPFGLLELVQEHFKTLMPTGDGRTVLVLQSPKPLSYDRVGALYDALRGMGNRVRFIGGDLFSLENYRIINRDVTLCALLALGLNLALFYLFTRRISPLLILFVGSLVSYITGFFAVGVTYGTIFAIVIAFTSTFVGFNNESLVHLSGLDSPLFAFDGPHRGRILGIFSAIGSTLLGFAVLAFSQSVLVRQMALAALGGTAGFLAFLYVVRSHLTKIRFHAITLPALPMSRLVLAILSLLGVAGLAAAPHIATSIASFRYESPTLSEQSAFFAKKLETSHMGEVVALEVPDATEPGALYSYWQQVRANASTWNPHPLDLYSPTETQRAVIELLLKKEPEAVASLQKQLSENGLVLTPQSLATRGLAPTPDRRFLRTLEGMAPFKWHAEVDGKSLIFASGATGSALPLGTLSLDPSRYYNTILTDLSRELALFFTIGLFVMAAYLAWMQRSFWRTLYIVAPVFLCAGAFSVWSAVSGTSLNIVHFMGFALNIALATDYTSVAISNDHESEELTKVLVTGTSSLVTFGILILAKHPVLQTLGFTVATGCLISLVFALFFPLKRGIRVVNNSR